MEKTALDRVFDKKYGDLSLTEQEEFKDLFQTEEEFTHIKTVLQAAHESATKAKQETILKPQIKENLDHLFQTTYQNKGILWYNSLGSFFIHSEKKWHQQNLTRIAAVLLLALLSTPLWFTNQFEEKPVLAQLDKKKEVLDEGTSSPEIKQPETQMKANPAIPNPIPKPAKTQLDEPTQGPWDGKAASEELSTNFSNLGAPSPSVIFDSEPTVKRMHPDGVFVEKAKDGRKSATGFKVEDNAYVLDFITAAY